MAERDRSECVLVFKRVYDVPIERMWRAWTEAAELAKWYLAGDDHIIHSAEVDLRVGGLSRIAFGPPGRPPFVEISRYLEITPPTRIVTEGVALIGAPAMEDGGKSSLELADLGDGRTELTLTTTGGGELWRHGEGWVPCLDSLGRHLASPGGEGSASKEDACILTLTRIYEAPIEAIWRAWTDATELAKWYLAGPDHVIHFAEADVRIGGTYRIGFGPPGKTPYVETGCYTEVSPMRRLAFEAGVTVGEGGPTAIVELNVIEFTDLGGGRTKVVLTDNGPDAWRSGEGWIPCLESLAR
ncbi:MAG TPA: SRPBCC family protein, partial [Caulobacteraceae bacterium]|nr:SRPBCC family protein [Caulobacteraceae bacterium]